jgi:hypothetical protein
VAIDLSQATVDNVAAGIVQLSGSMRVRGSTFTDVMYSCVVVRGGSADLGTADSLGGNLLEGTDYALSDERPARGAPGGDIIELRGSMLNGMSFAADTVVTGPADVAPYYRITDQNNRIRF